MNRIRLKKKMYISSIFTNKLKNQEEVKVPSEYKSKLPILSPKRALQLVGTFAVLGIILFSSIAVSQGKINKKSFAMVNISKSDIIPEVKNTVDTINKLSNPANGEYSSASSTPTDNKNKPVKKPVSLEVKQNTFLSIYNAVKKEISSWFGGSVKKEVATPVQVTLVSKVVEKTKIQQQSTKQQPKITTIQPIIKKITINKPVEKVIIQKTTERIISGVTKEDLEARIQQLSNRLTAQITKVADTSASNNLSNFRAIALTNRIDNLSNITVSGVKGLTDADIPNNITASNYLPLSGGTLIGIFNGTTATFSNKLGVGTTSPSDTLAVNGAIYLSRIQNPSVTSNRLYNNGGSLYWAGSLIGGASTGNWTTDGTNAWRASGNVGIGTTSPYLKLSVTGNGVFEGKLKANSFDTTSTTATSTFAGNIVVSGNSKLSKITDSTLSGTTTNIGTINGGTINSRIVQHCTTITDSGYVGTNIPTATTTSGISNFYKINFGTVLNDPDSAADLVNSQIKVPSWAKYVQVSGHMDFPKQTIQNAVASVHLFRNDSYTPEAYYHTAVAYPIGSALFSVTTALGISPVIPVQGPNETWQLYGKQDSGATQNVSGPAEWLSVCFYP